MKTLLTTLFSLLLIVSACSQQDLSDLPPSIRDLENLTAFPAVEDPQRVELVRETVFGDTDEVIIGRISDAVVDDRGRVFIYDGQQIAVYVFNSDGSFHGIVGRQGSGPGEYQRPFRLEIISNRLYIEDLGSTRFNVYSLDSLEPVNTILLERPDVNHIEELNTLIWRGVYLRSDESFIVRYGRQFSPSNPDNERPLLYYIYEDGDIMPDKVLEQNFENIFLTDPSDPLNNFSLFLFTPAALFTLGDDDRMYSTQSVDFLINIHDRDGNHLRSIYYPINKRPIDKEEMADEFSNDMHKAMIRNYDLYDTWPAIRSIMVDDEDRIWVSSYGDTDEEDVWWILENSGELIGSFNWPRNEIIYDIKGGYLYSRWTDDEGLSTIGKYSYNILPAAAEN